MVETGGFTELVGTGFNLSPVVTFLQWGIPLAIFFVCVWYMTKLFSFNIKVHIHNPTKSGNIKETDKARLSKKKDTPGVKEFVLMKNKTDWRGPIPQKFLMPTKKLFSRVGYEVYMIRDIEGKLQPILPPSNADVQQWEGMNAADIQWAFTQIQEGINVYAKDDFFLKYGQVIIPIVGFAIIGVIMLVLFKQLDPLAEAFNNAAAKAAEAIAASNTQVIQ